MRGVKFVDEHEEAVHLRKQGLSIVVIEKRLGINRSTLSSWFRDIVLAPAQRVKLNRARHMALVNSRAKAVAWHNAQKAERLAIAEKEARALLTHIDTNNNFILEFAVAMLYWGEGAKKSPYAGIGNTDARLLKVFILALRSCYGVPIDSIKCELNLRMDQDQQVEKSYWSRELQIPIGNFRRTAFDKRTAGSKTFVGYHGVCTVRCSNVAIQRKLVNISKLFAEKVLLRA